MDVEKYTNSKVYEFFEWSFKLIVWNLLTIFITCLVGAIPFLGFYLAKKGIFASICLILAFVFAIATFIPCYVTIFCCIKIYKEDGYAETFALYFDRLWDNIKALYKLELIIIPISLLFVFAIYIYYAILIENPEWNTWIMIFSIGYYFLMICLIILFLCFLNLPMVVGHFRMKTKSLMRFTLKITFKKIFSTALYLLILIMPLLLSLFINFLFPVWILVGFSLPLYLMYFIARRDYWKLIQDINEIDKEEN